MSVHKPDIVQTLSNIFMWHENKQGIYSKRKICARQINQKPGYFISNTVRFDITYIIGSLNGLL